MRCEDLQAHIPDHLAGSLPAATADEIAAHLETCAACTAEVQGAEETWQRLATIRAPRADSAAMRARFNAVLEGYEQGSEHSSRNRGRWTHYSLQFAAAAAVLVLGIGLGRALPAPAPAPDPQIGEMRAELRSMHQMVTLSLLQQQSASQRLKGVSFTEQIEQPGVEITTALLDTLMHDPNVNVRLASIDALKRLGARESVRRGAADALPRQTAPLVQIALIDFLVEMNGREAVDTLRRMSQDPMVDMAVRERAAQGLEQL